MASSNHFENVGGSKPQIRMTDPTEWKRMVREIVTLRQVNAELAERVTTLEMQLEDIEREELHEVVSVSLVTFSLRLYWLMMI
jgi:DNA repair ATPase RecN